MKNDHIEEVLQELYSIDESLKTHEEELRSLIQKMMHAQPDITIDKDFVDQLRAELLDTALTHSQAARGIHGTRNKLVGVLALMLLIAIPVVAGYIALNNPASTSDKVSLFRAEINDADAEAFGSLNTATPALEEQITNDAAGAAAPSRETPLSAPAGKGGGGTMGFAPEGGTAPMIAPRPYPYEITRYIYTYAGEEISLNDSQLPVYRRTKSDDAARSLAQLFTTTDMGLIDLKNMQNAKVDSISLIEDRDNGYYIHLSPREGTVSISRNWQRWQIMDSEIRCIKAPCPGTSGPITQENMPADDALIAVADAFLASFGIDTSSYGNPRVNLPQEYTIMMSEGVDTTNLSMPYYGGSVSVVYPLLLDDAEVVDGSGHISGISVDIDIREMQATGAHNIFAQQFERSRYTAVTDMQEIITFINDREGRYYPNEEEITIHEITITLGTPERKLMHTWLYDEESRSSKELFVPALVFPVDSLSEDVRYFWQDRVVVPLISEMLEIKQPPIGFPEPLPLIGESVVPAESPPTPDETISVEAEPVPEIIPAR